jgi:PST family polysaccharide transporter
LIKTGPNSYKSILRSSAIVGTSSVIEIFFRIVRTKCLALLLGTAGVGLFAMFDALAALASTISSGGVGFSGVRQIAEGAHGEDAERTARIVVVLRKLVFLLGVVGAVVFLLLRKPLCQMTFGSLDRLGAFTLLAVAVFFGTINIGQRAVVQGLRRIKELAVLSIVGAFTGSVIGVPLIYFLGEKGVVPCILAVNLAAVLSAWIIIRRLGLSTPRVPFAQARAEGARMVQFGMALLGATVLTLAVNYLIRLIVMKGLGLAALGLYQAASSLSLLYISYILQVMGTDFYPRLTAEARDSEKCVHLVNEQTEISILLAVPGLLGTMACASLIIKIFYSGQFELAAEVLNWQVMGCILRVAAWPMGFVLLAQGRGNVFFMTEMAANAVHLFLAWLLVKYVGLPGAGMAFLGLYIFYVVLIYWVLRVTINFRWTGRNMRHMTASILIMIVTFLLVRWFKGPVGVLLGLVAAGAASIYTVIELNSILQKNVIMMAVNWFRRYVPKGLSH